MSDDPLLEDISIGRIQTSAIDVENALESLEAAMSNLDIDRRASMPQDKNSLEYRLRDAHANLQGAKNELQDEGNL